MAYFNDPHVLVQWILGALLILSALGVILVKNPVHASLSFLLTLLTLAAIYLQLSAQFISVMQILVYAGAILVLFMFVIILFQDAHEKIDKSSPQSALPLIVVAISSFFAMLFIMGMQLIHLPSSRANLPADYGTVQSLGKALYIDFFFPFEAVTPLFLIAAVGALYIGKRIKEGKG